MCYTQAEFHHAIGEGIVTAPMTLLKLMTFNVRVNTPYDGENAWPYRVPAVAQAIRNSQAAIIGTQEMRPPMIDDLVPLLPEYRWVGGDRGDGETSSIGYRPDLVELLETGDFMLSETPDQFGRKGWDADCPRICTWALLRTIEDGRKFAFFNAHLDHVGLEARWRSIVLIMERMDSFVKQYGPELPLVLTGDMNSEPNERCIALMSDERVNTIGLKNGYDIMLEPADDRRTFHEYKGGNQGEPIDYIFHSAQLHPVSIWIDRDQVDGRYPSDHYPVVMELALE